MDPGKTAPAWSGYGVRMVGRCESSWQGRWWPHGLPALVWPSRTSRPAWATRGGGGRFPRFVMPRAGGVMGGSCAGWAGLAPGPGGIWCAGDWAARTVRPGGGRMVSGVGLVLEHQQARLGDSRRWWQRFPWSLMFRA